MAFSTLKPKTLHRNSVILIYREGKEPHWDDTWKPLDPQAKFSLSELSEPRRWVGVPQGCVPAAPTLPVSTPLTQAVVAIVSQHEAIVASAAVIPWNVETLVDTAPIEVVVTFINV